jgi:hypothetical protein
MKAYTNTIKGDLILSSGQIGCTAGLKGEQIEYLEINSTTQNPSYSRFLPDDVCSSCQKTIHVLDA